MNIQFPDDISDEKLEEELKRNFGYNEFRPYQKEIIHSLLKKNDVLAVLPTGAGKSVCYQLPALLLEGTAIVISPLISLMQDQVVSLYKNGVSAAFINSSLSYQDLQSVLHNLADYKLLYVAPERLVDPQFLERLNGVNVSFFVIDEAHCISQWGHSFRVEYRKLSILKQSFPDCPIIALTATATHDVEKDIQVQLSMRHPTVIKGSFDRPNLTLRLTSRTQLDKQLNIFLERQKGLSGIIYSATRKGVDTLYEQLQQCGYSVGRYHAGLSEQERTTSQHAFLHDQVSIMVATVAFGMGIHKPDIRFVVHIDMPKSIEQYYQEIGRAGRDGLPAECLLLYSAQDFAIYNRFAEQIEDALLRELTQAKTKSMYRLCTSQNCRRIELLRYFGERFEKNNCALCDNCLDEAQEIDGSILAQKILSCVYRLKQNVGMRMLIDVLRGMKGQALLSRRYDQLSTYGLLSELPDQEVRYYIESLIHLGFLKVTEGEYPVVKWTETSPLIVYGKQQIFFKKRDFKPAKGERVKESQKSNAAATTTLKYDEEMYAILRQLRTDIARDEKVPPYVVFSDRALQEMALYFPRTEKEFGRINGVGPIKWVKYGLKFIEAIVAFKGPLGHEPVKEKIFRPLEMTGSMQETLLLFREGHSLDALAQLRNLSRSTIVAHLAEAIELGTALDLSSVISCERQKIICQVAHTHGIALLKPIKEQLPEDYTYDEIRLVVSTLRVFAGLKE